MKLTERDREISETLAYRIRFFSVNQIARYWWSNSSHDFSKTVDSASRRLRRLAKEKVLTRQTVFVAPELELTRPEFSWSPGEAAPHFGKLSWRLQSRWKEPPISTELYAIGPSGLREFGGRRGGPKRLDQVRHDLHMGSVYLLLAATDSTIKKRWISEDELAPHRVDEKLPDAMLRAYESEPTTVIEFGGAYDSEHIRSFHEDCEYRNLPYQIW